MSNEPQTTDSDDLDEFLSDAPEWTWWSTLTKAQKAHRKRLVANHLIVDEIADAGWLVF